MLEWVDPRSEIVSKKPNQIIQIDTILINMVERIIGLAIKKLKHYITMIF